MLKNRFRSSLALAILALTSVACSKVDFQKPSNTTNSSSTNTSYDACVKSTIEAMSKLTKILFVVDTSGSNVIRTKDWGTVGCADNDMTCLPPSDPKKEFRSKAIGNFLQKYRAKTNFQWSLITFADQSAHAFINSNGNDQFPLFAAANFLDSALLAFMGYPDNGPTPYGSALDLAGKAVKLDADLNAASKPNYVIVLLTDGFPTDYYDANNVFQPTMAISDVNELAGIAPGRVFLSTLFYNPNPDHTAPEPQKAITLLKAMATQGGGHFRSVNPGDGLFQIDDLIPGSEACK